MPSSFSTETPTRELPTGLGNARRRALERIDHPIEQLPGTAVAARGKGLKFRQSLGELGHVLTVTDGSN